MCWRCQRLAGFRQWRQQSGGGDRTGRGLRRRGCAAPARLYSDGTIAIGTSNLIVHDALRYGTRNLVLAANSLNVGNEAALADAAARGVLPPGLRLSQTLLSRLLIGDREMGAPALGASFSR